MNPPDSEARRKAYSYWRLHHMGKYPYDHELGHELGWEQGVAWARAESAAKDARVAELERLLAVTEHTSDVAHSSVFEMDARITTLETALQKIERYDDLPGDWTTTIARIARAALGAAQEPEGGET